MTKIILAIIFIAAVFLRFYQLDQVPNGLHIDEAINGVNGNFILHTGRDTNNEKWPLQTEVFGDYNPTGYAYLTIIPIIYFGLSEFSTRFPGALLGSLTVLASYLLAFSIFKNQKVALLSAFLIAVSPWHIVFSRSSEETLIALFFVVLGFALVFLSFGNKKLKFLIPGVLSLALSFFMYFTPRVFVPLILLAAPVILFGFRGKHWNTKYMKFLFYTFIFLVAIVVFLIFGVKSSDNRFNQVSIFGSLGTRLVMEDQIREDGISNTNVKVTQFFHNKLINYSLSFISNYIEYYSGSFLFMQGGLPIWFRVEGMGLIYLIELPFILIGLSILAVSKNKMNKIPLLWLLIAPVTAAITVDDVPNIRRSFLMFPMLEIVGAFGFFYILQNRKKLLKKLIIFFVAILFVYNFLYFLHQYFIHSSVHQNWYRNEGFGEMVKTVKSSYNNVDNVIVTKAAGGIYPLILFYMNYEPNSYLSKGLSKDIDYTGFGKFFFVPQACPSKEKDNRFPTGKNVYIDKGECEDSLSGKTILRKDGSRVFNVVYE